MLVGGRDGDAVSHVAAFKQRQALARAWFPMVVQAVLFDLGVEQAVNAAVRGFLADKPLHFVAKAFLFFGGQRLEAVADGVDEELFTDRKAHRQGVEPCCEERVVLAPVPGDRLVQIDQEAADDECGHGE